MRLAALSLVAMLLSGCTTVLLPNASTGRCYRATHAYVVGTSLWLGDAIDGWRCRGMREGDLALIGDKPGVKPAAPPR
jgi:uncharacterized protein YceK